MGTYLLKAEQALNIGLDEAWSFFSSPYNLSKITPPELNFKIWEKGHMEEIREGMLIDYTVSPVLGIPLHWQTEICKVIKNKSFTDRQLIGPYKRWEHTHTFTKIEGGVWMNDEVLYQLPLGFMGHIAHSLYVKQKLESIFAYRKEVLDKLFNTNANDPS